MHVLCAHSCVAHETGMGTGTADELLIKSMKDSHKLQAGPGAAGAHTVICEACSVQSVHASPQCVPRAAYVQLRGGVLQLFTALYFCDTCASQ